jgi:hypothetical protein
VLGETHVSTRTYGTVTHMPAEVLMEGRMSKAADVYSFGAPTRAGGARWGRAACARRGPGVTCAAWLAPARARALKERARTPPSYRSLRPNPSSSLLLPPPPPGVVLWELFQGHRPYAGMTHGQVLHAVSCGKTLAVPDAAPLQLKPTLARCLDPRPENRWAPRPCRRLSTPRQGLGSEPLVQPRCPQTAPAHAGRPSPPPTSPPRPRFTELVEELTRLEAHLDW